jgi:NADP-dependent 3-hydroxy acid dehydrogenase YdfG
LAKGKDLFQDGSLEDFEDMIQTNVLGLIYTTRILLPFLIKNKKGHVVNIGSVAGRWVYQGGAVYCASKFSVQALTEGLRMDLYGWPIKVTNIQPGMVETEFSQVRFSDEAKAKAVYQGMTPLKAQDVAEAVLWCLNRPSHVNIQEVVMYPTEQYSPNHVWRGE